MFRIELLDRVGGFDARADDPFGDLAGRLAAAGHRTATLDEVLCVRD